MAVFCGQQPIRIRSKAIYTGRTTGYGHGSAATRNKPCQRHKRPQVPTYRTRNAGLQ